MAVKTEKDLSESLSPLWLKSLAAIELGNFGYAISLLRAILKQEPEFLAGRQLLRRAEITKNKTQKRAAFLVPASTIWIMKAQRELKRDPKRTVEMIEEILEHEPFNRQANLLLKEAALGGGWPEIAVLALQTLLEENSRDCAILHELGRLYHDLGQSDNEADVYNRITEIDPNDAEAVRLGKDASASALMQSGGWTHASRVSLKGECTEIPDQQHRHLLLAEESLDRQINEILARHQSDPRNVDFAMKLGALYTLKGDLENAIAWYEYGAELTNFKDKSLAEKISELIRKRLDKEIVEHEDFLATHGPEDPFVAEKSEMLLRAKKERVELLLKDARRRFELNPADHELLLELGKNLFHAGQYREALPELQQARQYPDTRLKAISLLGRCYRELGMFDLAAQQLEEAVLEVHPMDPMRKELLYNLGLVYELLGEADKSIVIMKEVYDLEMGYRDVATRIGEWFEGKGTNL